MNTLIAKINFSALSQTEQAKVYSIIKKAQMCQQISDTEQKFINDMASMGEKSNPDQLNKAWASLVSLIGINAGSYLNTLLEKGFKDSAFEDSKVFLSYPQSDLKQLIKPLGGCLEKIEMVLNVEKSEMRIIKVN